MQDTDYLDLALRRIPRKQYPPVPDTKSQFRPVLQLLDVALVVVGPGVAAPHGSGAESARRAAPGPSLPVSTR